MKINVIGDIAGRYDELMLLLAKMPEADLIVSVGDMVDRGPKSKEVIEFFMTNPKAYAIYGNHEAMMYEHLTGQSNYGNWATSNGGGATLQSFNNNVPPEVIEWLKNLPLVYENDELIVSHAPITTKLIVPTNKFNGEGHNFIWNRYPPKRRQAKFMIHGHNWEYRSYKDQDGEYGICIDNCAEDVLTGIHWPTKEIFEQKYLP